MNGNAPSHEQVNDLVLLDVSKDAREAARDRADARLVEELNEGSRLKPGLKAIWKGGVAKEYYRREYTTASSSRNYCLARCTSA